MTGRDARLLPDPSTDDPSVGSPEQPASAEAELLARVRAGDVDAYSELFTQHRGAALAFARRLAGPRHAEDLVSEAFVKVLDMLRRDLGPTIAFRSYLYTAIRSLWANTLRKDSRVDLVEDYDGGSLELPSIVIDHDNRFDNQAIAGAFQALPARWQTVLWATQVEGRSHAEVAEIMDIKPNAVAALNFRAREGLRQAFLSQHLAATSDKDCATYLELLPSYARGALDKRRRPALEEHLIGCSRCAAALATLRDENDRLGFLLLPVALGVGASHRWLPAALGGGLTLRAAAPWAVATVAALTAVPLLFGPLAQESKRLSHLELRPAYRIAELREPLARKPTTPKPVHSPTYLGATNTPEPTSLTTTDAPQPTPSSTPPSPPSPPPPPPPPTTAPPPPPTPTPPQNDVEVGEIDVQRTGVLNQSASTVTIPLMRLQTGTTLVMDVINLTGLPAKLSSDWTCASRSGWFPDDNLTTNTSHTTCTYTGSDTTNGELKFLILASGASTLTVTVTPPPGTEDPDPADNTASATLNG